MRVWGEGVPPAALYLNAALVLREFTNNTRVRTRAVRYEGYHTQEEMWDGDDTRDVPESFDNGEHEPPGRFVK